MFTWIRHKAVLVLGFVLLAVVMPACGGGSQTADIPTPEAKVVAKTIAQPTATPELTATEVSPTPTQVPPTATPTAASTQVPPTPTAGHTPTATTIAMPDFELPDTSGSTVSLSKTLSHSHFAVLVFYRGHR